MDSSVLYVSWLLLSYMPKRQVISTAWTLGSFVYKLASRPKQPSPGMLLITDNDDFLVIDKV